MSPQMGEVAAVGADARLVIVRKAADEAVNNSTALQDDDELFFAVEANEVWKFDILLITYSHGTPDFKYAFTIPVAGAITGWDPQGRTIAEAPFNYTGASVIPGSSLDRYTYISGIYVGGVNAGTVQLQWAQNVLRVGDTFLRENSFIIAHQLA